MLDTGIVYQFYDEYDKLYVEQNKLQNQKCVQLVFQGAHKYLVHLKDFLIKESTGGETPPLSNKPK